MWGILWNREFIEAGDFKKYRIISIDLKSMVVSNELTVLCFIFQS